MRLYDVFSHAISLPKNQQADYVTHACDGDQTLINEVHALLDNDSDEASSQWSELVGEQVSALSNDVLTLVGHRFGAFKLTQLIGQGGMGAVYLASRDDGKFEQNVAIKVINQQLENIIGKEALIREASFMARLNHPNIGKVFDAGLNDDGYSYIVMEFVEGESIDALWRDEQKTRQDKLEIFCSLCDAIHHAHQMQVVHADLKPSNILLSSNNEIKVVDFGIARLFDNASTEVNPFYTSYVKALTANYACPEVKCGELPNTYSDIYSLGRVLGDLYDVLSPSEQSIELLAIIAKASSPSYQQRYPSVLDIKYDIERLLTQRVVNAYPASKWFHIKKFITKRHPLSAAVTAIGLSVVVYLVSNLYIQHQALKVAQAQSDLTVDKLSQLLEMADLKKTNGTELYAKDLLDNAKRLVNQEGNLNADSIAKIKFSLANSYESLGNLDEASALLLSIIDNVANLADKDIAYEAGERYVRHLLYSNEFHLIEQRTQVLVDNFSFIADSDLPNTLAQSKFYHQYLNGVKYHRFQSRPSELGEQHVRLLQGMKKHHWQDLTEDTKGSIAGALAGALLNQVPNGIEFSFEQISQAQFDQHSKPLITEAIAALNESIKWYKLQDNHIAIIKKKMVLGRALIELDQFSDGKAEMETALSSLQQMVGKSHPNNIQFYRMMAGFFAYDDPQESLNYALLGVKLAKNNPQVQPLQYVNALDALLFSLLNYGDFEQYHQVSNELFDAYLAMEPKYRTVDSLHVVAKILNNYVGLFGESPVRVIALSAQIKHDVTQFMHAQADVPQRVAQLITPNYLTLLDALTAKGDVISARLAYLRSTLERQPENARDAFFYKKRQLELAWLAHTLPSETDVALQSYPVPVFTWSDKEKRQSAYRIDVLLKQVIIAKRRGNTAQATRLLDEISEILMRRTDNENNGWIKRFQQAKFKAADNDIARRL